MSRDNFMRPSISRDKKSRQEKFETSIYPENLSIDSDLVKILSEKISITNYARVHDALKLLFFSKLPYLATAYSSTTHWPNMESVNKLENRALSRSSSASVTQILVSRVSRQDSRRTRLVASRDSTSIVSRDTRLLYTTIHVALLELFSLQCFTYVLWIL